MSYDVSLVIDTGAPDKTGVFWRNHTSNTAQMWREAGCDIAAFHGKPASELAAALAVAVEQIRSQPDRFRQFEPGNGWGSVESTLAFLTDVLEACRLHPLTTVAVSR